MSQTQSFPTWQSQTCLPSIRRTSTELLPSTLRLRACLMLRDHLRRYSLYASLQSSLRCREVERERREMGIETHRRRDTQTCTHTRVQCIFLRCRNVGWSSARRWRIFNHASMWLRRYTTKTWSPSKSEWPLFVFFTQRLPIRPAGKCDTNNRMVVFQSFSGSMCYCGCLFQCFVNCAAPFFFLLFFPISAGGWWTMRPK